MHLISKTEKLTYHSKATFYLKIFDKSTRLLDLEVMKMQSRDLYENEDSRFLSGH